MIKQLSAAIEKIKETVFKYTVLRVICYLIIALALLLVFLYTEKAEISFVYNEF
ncbi:MAG: teichoic acid D-Ala incorporation-associated protein DltX [Clostridiales bacterium]|nr:teichoic acid D-Ala incorporation-associated protein DltX [Clostridiales bacterium]